MKLSATIPLACLFLIAGCIFSNNKNKDNDSPPLNVVDSGSTRSVVSDAGSHINVDTMHTKDIPDTDKDGLNDDLDKCPGKAGPISNNGCPEKSGDSNPPIAVADSDGDGIKDDVDKCPTVAGPASNHGCPKVSTRIPDLPKLDSTVVN